MPPAPLDCTKAECDWKTPANCPDWDKMIKMLELHIVAQHGGQNSTSASSAANLAPKLEKLPRPSFQLEMSQAEWAFKKSQWDAYISQTPVSETVKVQQLRAACEDDLMRRVYDAGDLSSMNTESLLLDQIKKIAVRVVHKTLHLQNLWKMVQSPEESIRAFASRLVGTAELCDLFVTCSKSGCTQRTSFRDEVVLQALLKGMHDVEIRTRVLSRTQNDELKGLASIVDYIAAEEASSASFLSMSDHHTVAGNKSAYKRQHFQRTGNHDPSLLVKCGHCGSKHQGDNTNISRKQFCKAFDKKCSKCGKSHHFANVCRSSQQTNHVGPVVAATNAPDEPVTGALTVSAGFYAMQSTTPTRYEHLSPFIASLRHDGPVTTVPLPHLVHSVHSGWTSKPALPSPTIRLDVRIDCLAYTTLKIPIPRSSLRPVKVPNIQACADTGAQLTTIPIALLPKLGVRSTDVLPIMTNLNTVTGAPVELIGGILLEFRGINHATGIEMTSKQLAYVSTTIPYTFLSREACNDLGLIPKDFPTIGGCSPPMTVASMTCSNSGVSGPDDLPCSCPRRELPPNTPPTMPCAPTSDNLPLLRQYIVDRYAASAFNTCEQQPLPLMKTSPPLRLFLNENATPVAVHSPAAVPLHWDKMVTDGLERDVRLGVIERVPVNTPTTWCSRMVITPKHDGSPRRVVDYQAVNANCPRQTHHTRTPWQIASSVPPKCVKTVLDAWHGYHSVPIHPADRHITTFITKEGRFQYRTAPQGLLSAGDGYTQRFDEIIGNFPNHSKCVDDSILWRDNIESNFYATCEFLDKCGAAGIIFNRDKFQFACDEVDYVGFRITNEGIKPTKEFVDNILNFPTPKTITDVRSWFGCIQQIAYTFAISEVMLPFRQLLRPQVPFTWNEDLDRAFQASKEEILRQCETGVRLFNMSAPTGLATDWSKNCMGWWLVQRHCRCPEPVKLGCCKTGWQTVFCGSKFTTPAESRYAPIEGEAAAVVLGLDKCSHFVLGLPKLLLAVDHKPLVSIFNSMSLENIPNPRLFRLKHRSLKYRFTPCHVAGKKNVVPDTFSRRNDALSQSVSPESSIQIGYSYHMGPPNWVSAPVYNSCIATSTLGAMQCDTDEFITGVAMSNLQHFNYSSNQLVAAIATPDLQAVTWEVLEAACRSCSDYQLLHQMIERGLPEHSRDWEQRLLPYYKHRNLLTTIGPVVLVGERPVIPKSLRSRIIDHLHSGHPGLATMCQRLSSSLYWPNYTDDLIRAKSQCSTCMKIAPSNPSMPPRQPVSPRYPFQSVVCDFFVVAGHSYAALADRYSNWLSVLKLKQDTSQELINVLRNYFATFGVPELLSTDGATIFTSSTFRNFCQRWGIEQRISSAYHPRSNKRAELAVKQAKRLVQDSLGPGGSLDTDRMARALLAHRNTPDGATGVSPSQVIFGRKLRDFLPVSPGHYLPRPEWRLQADQRELALAKRHIKAEEALSAKCRKLPDLKLFDIVAIQDQNGTTPRRWSKTGKVMEVLGHDSYLIKVDGSNRLTQRNRQFLRRIEPYKCYLDEFPPATVLSPEDNAPIDPIDQTYATDNIDKYGPPDSSNQDLITNSMDKSDQLPQPPLNDQADPQPLDVSQSTCENPTLPGGPSQSKSFNPSLRPVLPDTVNSEENIVPGSGMSTNNQSHRNLPTQRPRVLEHWVVNPKFVRKNDGRAAP